VQPRRNRAFHARICVSSLLLTKGTRSADLDKRVVDVLGERLPSASVVEFHGDHAHHIESIDAFLGALEAHLTHTEAAPVA
jgi:hypothetical protein